jgi:transcriptional regulator with XRE-family HTH domain
MTSAGPEPGWYFDPDGGDHDRFWNGEAWTEHRRSRPSTIKPPSQQLSETWLDPRNGERSLLHHAHPRGRPPECDGPFELGPVISSSDEPASTQRRLEPDATLAIAAPTRKPNSPPEAASARRARRESQPNRARSTPRTAPSSPTCHNDPVAEGRAGVKLSLAVVEDLKNKGFNQSEIAEMYGVTRQYVSWIKHTYGGRLTPRELVNQHFPFEVPMEMGQTSPFKRLRDHGEYVATGGVGMSEGKLQRLRSFYRKLRDEKLVLEFDPSIPPIPGISNKGGWAYRQRTPTDEDLLIRVNEYTDLTEEGRGIWRLPPLGP